MTLFQVATYLFAAIGVGSVAYLVLQLLKGRRAGEDGPIRVKGGSVEVENTVADWEKDDGDDPAKDPPEYHSKGRTNRWTVSFYYKKTNTSVNTSARRVVIEVEDSFSNSRLAFRANGSARVVDRNRVFSASGKNLTHKDTKAWIKKVKLFPGDEYQFEKEDKPVIVLEPIT